MTEKINPSDEKSEIIWITGASSGIGKAVALEFIDKSHRLALSARRSEELMKIKSSIEGDLVEIFPCDISSFASVSQTFEAIDKVGSIDCLINNAGMSSFKSAENNSIEEIQDVINTNLLGAIYTIKSVLPEMIKRKRGTIINIISVVSDSVYVNSSAYSASKTGLLAYANVLREEVRKYNIRVINILPGATGTAIWPEKVLEKNIHRMMTPYDLAKFIYFCYSSFDTAVIENAILRPIEGDLR